MNPTPTTGTTLEIVAPYLPYAPGLFGPFQNSQYPGEIRPLLGLSSEEGRGVAETENALGFKEFIFLEACLPVLRPFEQLDKELPDGTVPAVEIARMIKLLMPADVVTLCEYFPNHRHCGNCIQIERASGWSVRITEEDWNTLFWRGFVIEYLRKNHFAVGLKPHQYIVKEAGK